MMKKYSRLCENIIGIAIFVIIFGFAGNYVLKDYVKDNNLTRRERVVANEKTIKYLNTNLEQEKFIYTLVPASKKAYQKYQVLPSITLGQAVLESTFGKSTLANKYHNLFGIKAEKGVVLPTQEVNDKNKVVTVKATFATYPNDTASVMDHAYLMLMGTPENKKRYLPVRQAKDYRTAASALQAAGYATDPEYATKLVNTIESYHLQRFDPKS